MSYPFILRTIFYHSWCFPAQAAPEAWANHHQQSKCAAPSGYGHRHLHSVVQSELSWALKRLWEVFSSLTGAQALLLCQGVIPGVLSVCRAEVQGEGRKQNLSSDLYWERSFCTASLGRVERRAAELTWIPQREIPVSGLGQTPLINKQIPLVFSRMGTGTHWAQVLPECTTLRGWSYAHNDYSTPFLFMHELDLFF